MSDSMSAIANQPVTTPSRTEAQVKQDINQQVAKQSKGFEERSVILSVENLSKDTKKVKDPTKDSEEESIIKNVSKVTVSYDKSGIAIVKFLDSKGNTVFQVPPEEYLRMKEQAEEKDDVKIPDIINKKV
ncbi:MAG: hypothetical protein N2738_03375 [Thermodesulfovibrionales bacterium]|nr:hypothetical protein [Thermodesulfovibrionales bacterium]